MVKEVLQEVVKKMNKRLDRDRKVEWQSAEKSKVKKSRKNTKKWSRNKIDAIGVVSEKAERKNLNYEI